MDRRVDGDDAVDSLPNLVESYCRSMIRKRDQDLILFMTSAHGLVFFLMKLLVTVEDSLELCAISWRSPWGLLGAPMILRV